MTCTLVLIRHAKSDWSHPVADFDRPLAPRGRRQAPAVGEWLTQHLHRQVDLVLVSPAARACQTWELISGALMPAPVRVRTEPGVYTFVSTGLGAVVAAIDPQVHTAAIIGHNPAMEDLVGELSGTETHLTTASLAVIELAGWSAPSGVLVATGRPADGLGAVRGAG